MHQNRPHRHACPATLAAGRPGSRRSPDAGPRAEQNVLQQKWVFIFLAIIPIIKKTEISI